MRDLARIAAFVVAMVVVGRDMVVAGASAATTSSSVIVLVAVLAALTLWRDGVGTISGLALAGHYVLSLGLGDVAIDLAAPVVGALVLLYLDLVDVAASTPPGHRVDRALVKDVARDALLVTGAATLTGAVAVAFAAGPWPSAEWLRAAGALGVGAVVAIPLLLARRAQ